MSPRHLSKLQQSNPKDFYNGQDKVWNTFVTITHKVGLANYFSFTPDFSEYRAENGGDQINPDIKPL
jgi:hypothetical protein